MKRPLFLVCIALTIVLAIIGNAGDPELDSPAFYGETLLLKAAEQENVLKIKGCVASCSTVSEGRRLSISQISVQNEDNSELSFLSELKLIVTTERMDIMPGDFIEFNGEYRSYQEARNPGNFDTRAYYLRENVIGSVKNPDIISVQKGKTDLSRILYTIRETLRLSCEQILDEKKGRILSAVCLGEKSNMEQEWKETYQEGGISHILAVSGLHITMVGMSVFRLLRWLRMPYAGTAVLSGTISLFYVMMTGSGVSAWRALVMFWIWLGAQVCGRKYDMRTSMAAAALLLVLSDASCVQTASFCLSFGAVAVISILLPCITKTWRTEHKIVDAAVGSAGIFLGTLPVTLYFFYQVAPWSALVNLFVVALMPSLMGMGFLASAAGVLAREAGIFFASAVSWLLAMFELLCRMEQRLPGAIWVAGQPTAAEIAVYYALLAATGVVAKKWSVQYKTKKRRIQFRRTIKTKHSGVKAGTQQKLSGIQGRLNNRNTQNQPGVLDWNTWKIRLLWCASFILCIGLMCRNTNHELRITCLDVGQGDCSLVQLPDGTDCLIDGGSSSQKHVWEYRIGETVKYYGVDTLEYVFLSHADSDHTSGIREFLLEYRIGPDKRNTHGITIKHLVLPPVADASDFMEIKLLAAANGISILTMGQGDEIAAEDWSIACLAPMEEALSGEKNQDSMVLMLQYQEFKMLFTGDLEGEAEERLVWGSYDMDETEMGNLTTENSDGMEKELTREADLDADILKVGHHGSKNGSSEAFLAAVSPQLAVISCAEDNSYGHPAGETVERLTQAGARIIETAKNGAVQIVTDGFSIWYEGYLLRISKI